ncbi:MAG: hypothetical protein ACR2JU_09260 [Nocardioidaceae bacterium]
MLQDRVAALRVAELAALESRRERILLRGGETTRLKYGISALVDTSHATCPEVPDGGHWVIRTAGVRDGCIRLAGCYRTDDPGFAAWTQRRRPRPGDVVLTREAPAGEAAVIPSSGSWCLGQRSVLLVPKAQELMPAYLVMALYGSTVQDEVRLRARSTTAAHLNVSEIGDLRVPMPAVADQAVAVDEFAIAQARCTSLLGATTELAARLAEYRDALITEAVTGQLDVTKMSDARMDERAHAALEGAVAS